MRNRMDVSEPMLGPLVTVAWARLTADSRAA